VTSALAANGGELETREYAELPHAYRTEFQRDRDRIVHSRAFRRLEYKTQVFVNHLGDNYRTRLTHSIEVAQISRSVARALSLNEDLAETLGLAHDLGHPPFGHAGEKALHDIMRDFGGFDHNDQTLRIVTHLEQRYPAHPGLNLTLATRLGLQKHNKLPAGMSHTLEAQIVDYCDEIAYNNHDIDDGLDSGLLRLKDLSTMSLWQEQWEATVAKYPDAAEYLKIRFTIRNLINEMVNDLIETTRQNLIQFQVATIDDVLSFQLRNPGLNLAALSITMREKVTAMKKFLMRHLYRHLSVLKMAERADVTIRFLYNHFMENPEEMSLEYRDRIPVEGVQKVASDFIAGMTDRYAVNHYRLLRGAE